MNIEISKELSRVTPEQIARIYESVGFGDSLAYLERPDFKSRLFGPGLHGFFAFDEHGTLLGFLRAFSDSIVVAWIAEICVRPEFQRKGIGSALLLSASRDFSNLALYADSFAHTLEFFRSCGLKDKSILVACSRAPLPSPSYSS